VHESIGNELKEFRAFWPHGDIYINPDRSIYRALGGGSIRKLGLTQLFSPWVIMGAYKETLSAVRNGEITGNLRGNGMLLGGVMITSQNKTLLYQWKQEYHTLANTSEIHQAALQIPKQKPSHL